MGGKQRYFQRKNAFRLRTRESARRIFFFSGGGHLVAILSHSARAGIAGSLPWRDARRGMERGMMPAHQWGARMRVGLIPALLILGLGLRSYHYLRDRAVWQD